jgi:hypothetical protein
MIDLPATGGSFTVDVIIEDVTDLGSFQFGINYNSDILEASAVIGPFLGSTGRNVASSISVLVNLGVVGYSCSTTGANPGPSGDGVLASITFTVKSPECSSLEFQSISIRNTQDQLQAVDSVLGSTICNIPENAQIQSVPTLSELGIIIFSLVILASGILIIIRRTV